VRYFITASKRRGPDALMLAGLRWLGRRGESHAGLATSGALPGAGTGGRTLFSANARRLLLEEPECGESRLSLFAGLCLSAQTPAKFEVASIKPCRSGETGGKNAGGRGTAAGRGPGKSPGRLTVPCAIVADMMRNAYVGSQDDPPIHASALDPDLIRGCPSWVYSEPYTIEAAGEGTASMRQVMGPMLQSLLEDRFRLRVHRETEEIPVYALTVAKGGFKLQPMEAGGCIEQTLLSRRPRRGGPVATPGGGNAVPGMPEAVSSSLGTRMRRVSRARNS